MLSTPQYLSTFTLIHALQENNNLKDIQTQVVTWLSHKKGWVVKRKFALTPMYEVNFSIFWQTVQKHEHVNTSVGYKVAKGNQYLHYSYRLFNLHFVFSRVNYMKMHRIIYHRPSIKKQPSLLANWLLSYSDSIYGWMDKLHLTFCKRPNRN